MRRLSNILVTVVFSLFNVAAHNRGPATTDPAFYAVSYVEVMPSSKAAAVAALKQYRDASRKDEGYVSVQLLEQMGRSAHFAASAFERASRSCGDSGVTSLGKKATTWPFLSTTYFAKFQAGSLPDLPRKAYTGD